MEAAGFYGVLYCRRNVRAEFDSCPIPADTLQRCSPRRPAAGRPNLTSVAGWSG
jgi:hypothetical protein